MLCRVQKKIKEWQGSLSRVKLSVEVVMLIKMRLPTWKQKVTITSLFPSDMCLSVCIYNHHRKTSAPTHARAPLTVFLRGWQTSAALRPEEGNQGTGHTPPLPPLPWFLPRPAQFRSSSPLLLPPLGPARGPEVQAGREREAWPQGC